MTIQEKIYTRFITAVCRLKEIDTISNDLYTEVGAKYLNKTVNSQINFSIKLMEEDFLVQTAIVTALMEVSDNWEQFKKLYKKQTEVANNILTKATENPIDFDSILKGILSAPPPKKKKKN